MSEHDEGGNVRVVSADTVRLTPSWLLPALL